MIISDGLNDLKRSWLLGECSVIRAVLENQNNSKSSAQLLMMRIVITVRYPVSTGATQSHTVTSAHVKPRGSRWFMMCNWNHASGKYQSSWIFDDIHVVANKSSVNSAAWPWCASAPHQVPPRMSTVLMDAAFQLRLMFSYFHASWSSSAEKTPARVQIIHLRSPLHTRRKPVEDRVKMYCSPSQSHVHSFIISSTYSQGFCQVQGRFLYTTKTRGFQIGSQ